MVETVENPSSRRVVAPDVGHAGEIAEILLDPRQQGAIDAAKRHTDPGPLGIGEIPIAAKLRETPVHIGRDACLSA